MKFRGYLANENAELLRSRIHAAARPHKTVDGELDPRSREKRQADALTATLTIAAAATDTGFKPRTADSGTLDAGVEVLPFEGVAGDPAASGTDSWVPGFGAKANITVTIDFEDLKSAAADATGDLGYGGGLSAAAIRRMACDAKIIPLVLGSNSEPLDVGRAERLVTRAMRRALNLRDKGCVVCGAPPIYCDAHHVQSWIDGGETSIWNLVLLCRAHHVALHAGHWVVTITGGVVHVSRPSWADPTPQPRPSVAALLAATAAQRPNTGATAGPLVPSRRAGRRSTRRSTRWSADETMMQEAARFAVWGESPATEAVALARDRSASSSEAIRPDPWSDTALI